jgi:HEAT repeat protein
LEDENKYFQVNALKTLGKIKDSRAVKPIIELLPNNDPSIRTYAIWSLQEIGHPLAVEPIINVLEDSDSVVRENAATALASFNNKSAIVPLKKRLHDEKANVRQAAAQAMLRLNWTPVSQDERIMFSIAMKGFNTLVEIGEPAISSLIDLLKDNDVRWDAARALVEIGEPAAKPISIAIDNFEDDPDTKEAADWVLKEIVQAL